MEYLIISRFGMLLAAIMMSVVITRINSLEITDRLDYSSNGQIGTNATFRCDWVKTNSNFGLRLDVVTQSNKLFVSYYPAESVVSNLSNFHPRLVVTITMTSLTMTIMSISCSDIDTYICRMRYIISTVPDERISTGRLVDITIPPHVPVMTQPPSLVEGSPITYRCTAILGRPNKGQIVWKAYVNGQIVELPSTPSVKETSNDNNCTVTGESTVTFQANRTHTNITLSCFSINQDYPQAVPPLCASPVTDLCDHSQPLNILYATSKLIVSRIPQSDVEEGSSITLTCQAEGNPQPTYTWRQVGNDNKSISGVQEGLTNKLILRNISVTDDTGVYNCTATNKVGSDMYSLTGQVSVNVVTTTTTTITTTTTRDMSITSSSSQATSPQPSGCNDDSTNFLCDSSPDETNYTAIAVGVPLGLVLIAFIIYVIIIQIRRTKIIKRENSLMKNSNTKKNQDYNKIGAMPYVNTEFHAYETANIKPISLNEVTPASSPQQIDKSNVSIHQGEQEYHLYDEIIYDYII